MSTDIVHLYEQFADNVIDLDEYRKKVSSEPGPGQMRLFDVNGDPNPLFGPWFEKSVAALKFPKVEGLEGFETYEQVRSEIENAFFGNDETQHAIAMQGLILTLLLIKKNQRYGNSALQPMEVFAKGVTPRQRMGVRMDDKVNRLAKGLNNDDGEDALRDLAGYLLLMLAGEQTGALA